MSELIQNSSALVVLSGGQDSVTCLGVAMAKHPAVEAIGFNYGQRHCIEIKQARKICENHNIKFTVIDIAFLGGLVRSALTGEGEFSESHPDYENLPSSFVPARNAIFLTLTHALAQTIRATHVYTGTCETDFSGYPDCRDAFIKNLRDTLNQGYETNIEIVTPLMFKDKAATFALAEEYGVLYDVLEYSHTCYEGDRKIRHEWGYGCGKCPACQLRAKGWEKFGKEYPGSYACYLDTFGDCGDIYEEEVENLSAED